MSKTKPTKTRSEVDAARVQMARMTVFDPLPGLTPERLVQYHDQFRRGYLRNAALMWARIEELDDKAQTVIPKRKKTVPRHGIEFVTSRGMEKNARALQHKKALEYAYDNLSVTNALDLNERGGVSLLLRQMMDAVGKRYSNHELVWRPSSEGITAEARWVPLQFFENTTGALRYLPSEAVLYGLDLEPGGWITTVHDGLMFATAVCYLYKRMPLRDWLVYCYQRGGTGLDAETSATKDSPEWKDLEDALRNFGMDLSLIHGPGTKITSIDASARGELPYGPLVDLMNRAIVSIWRGGDLSTMSGGQQSVGASIQGEEQDILEQDDAEVLTETLNEQFDRWVIRYMFDEDPLCWVRVKTAQRQDVKQDLEVDRELAGIGFPQTQEALAQRYNRPLPEDGQTILKTPQQPALPAIPLANDAAKPPMTTDSTSVHAAQASIVANAIDEAAAARAQALQALAPWKAKVEAVLADSTLSESEVLDRLEALAAEVTRIPLDFGPEAEIQYRAMVAGLINGMQMPLGQGGKAL